MLNDIYKAPGIFPKTSQIFSMYVCQCMRPLINIWNFKKTCHLLLNMGRQLSWSETVPPSETGDFQRCKWAHVTSRSMVKQKTPLICGHLEVWTGLPDSSVGKESACNAGDPALIPGSGRSIGEGIGYPLQYSWTFLVAQLVKNLPAVIETCVWSLGWEDPLEKGRATHSSILAWRIPWTVSSMGSERGGHDWVTFTSLRRVSLEDGMATHSNILAWRSPWTEEPGGLQSMGSQKVGHNWATFTHLPQHRRSVETWGVS